MGQFNPGCGCCSCDPTNTLLCGHVNNFCAGNGSTSNAAGVSVSATGPAPVTPVATDASGNYCLQITKVGTYTVSATGPCGPVSAAPVTFTSCGTSKTAATIALPMPRMRFLVSLECSTPPTVSSSVPITGPSGATIISYTSGFDVIYCVSKAGSYQVDIPGNSCNDAFSGSFTAPTSCTSPATHSIVRPGKSYTYTLRGLGCVGVADTKTASVKAGCPLPDFTLSADRYDSLFVPGSSAGGTMGCNNMTVDRSLTVSSGYACICCNKPIVIWPTVSDSQGTYSFVTSAFGFMVTGCLTKPGVAVTSDICGPQMIDMYYYYAMRCAGGSWELQRVIPICQFTSTPTVLQGSCPAPGKCSGIATSPVAVADAHVCTPAAKSLLSETGVSSGTDLNACPPASITFNFSAYGFTETATLHVT